MTTDPTEKHREEAQGIVRAWLLTGNPHYLIDYKDHLIDRIALALSSRDKEIREVLEGLRHRYSGCWCPNRHPRLEETMPHEPACLTARGLWDRLQS